MARPGYAEGALFLGRPVGQRYNYEVVARLVLWFGDALVRLHRRFGAAYSVAVFALGWIVLTVVAHFGGADGSPALPQAWSSAVVWGFVLTCIGFLLVHLFNSWR
jgi:uncharacterized YccA/Bax inhibitor family protein